MFSHTLGRGIFLKCYLMLAVVRVDTVVFFRRALEWTHNNFTIYCGLVMVYCHCYIGLECTILFLGGLTQELGFQLLISAAHIQSLLNFNKSSVKYKIKQFTFSKGILNTSFSLFFPPQSQAVPKKNSMACSADVCF